MTLPSLPFDVWFRISTFLGPDSLSALSQVNQMLHKIAVDISHFKRHICHPPRDRHRILQSFRSIRALNHAPSFCFAETSSKLIMVCVVRDTLLFLDVEKAVFIIFPSGITVHAEQIGGVEANFKRTLSFLVAYKSVVLPGKNVAFLQGNASSVKLAVLDMETGHVAIHPLRRRLMRQRSTIHRKRIALAGVKGEWIMYYSSMHTIQLIDWRSGNIVREVTQSEEQSQYVIGEIAVGDGSTVVGLVEERDTQHTTKFLAKGFDGIDETFEIDGKHCLHSVLRSADTKTHVLITANPGYFKSPIMFLAHRKDNNEHKWWSGLFKEGRFHPVLTENGKVISVSKTDHTLDLCVHYREYLTNNQLWITLNDDATTWCTAEEVLLTGSDKERATLVWKRQTPEGGLAIIVEKKKDVVKLVRVFRDGGLFKQQCVEKWEVEKLAHIAVVADHYILGICENKDLMLWHFGKFCNGSDGVAECPLKGLLTFCYFPSEFRDGDERVQSKRRRISDGVERVAVDWI